MTVASMTGFARADGFKDGYSWTWEIRSVNGRNLDVRLRLPPGMELLEADARAAVAAQFKRGNLSISLNLTRPDKGGKVRINREVLDQVLALTREMSAELEAPAPRIEGLLGLRGVLEPVEEEESEKEREARVAAMAESLTAALKNLATARLEEGKALAAAVGGHLDRIGEMAEAAAATAAAQPAALRQRLKDQVEALLEARPALSEDRLAQEAALLATKADIREEIDRLRAHTAAARELISEGGAIGRRLDFLCQEFNREANTLCSKSSDIDLTRIGLDLKAAIEQLREQVQNIE